MTPGRAMLAIVLLALAVFIGLGTIWLLLWGFATILAVIAFLVVAVVIFAVLLGILVFLAAIPYYVLKGGRGPEPGTYRIEDVRPVREDEKK